MTSSRFYKIVALSAALIAFIIVGVVYFKYSEAETSNITLSTTVGASLTLGLDSGTYAFGSLTPGTPKKGSNGIIISVTTSASNGYTLGVNDNVAGTDSALLHTDTTTRIADYTGTIGTPTLWNVGVDTGLGMTMYAADTTKEGKWGTGVVYNDANNKYAGVPQNVTTFHTSAGYKAGVDTSSIAFMLDVPGGQKTGDYSGIVTITATAVML